MSKQELPILAHSLDIEKYTPLYGDYVIWSRMVSTIYGFVVGYSAGNHSVSMIAASNPALLLMLTDKEKEDRTIEVKIEKIHNSSRGVFTIMRHDKKSSTNVWYV